MLLGQRPRYQEGPPEGAGQVRMPPSGARRPAEPNPFASAGPPTASLAQALLPAPAVPLPERGAEPGSTPDRSKPFGSHGHRPWLQEVVTGHNFSDMLYYDVYGLYEVIVIARRSDARSGPRPTRDRRFSWVGAAVTGPRKRADRGIGSSPC
jgi:hypothetical protein